MSKYVPVNVQGVHDVTTTVLSVFILTNILNFVWGVVWKTIL